MIKVYQKRWFDIEFADFCQLNSKQVADEAFYQKFYNQFYKQYSHWDNLPQAYRNTRSKAAEHLASLIAKRKIQQVLTLGCGNGIIEKELLKRIPNVQIHAYEPNETNLVWLKQLPNVKLYFGEFPQCLPTNQVYQLVYLCDVDNVFSNAAYVEVLKKIKQQTLAPILLTIVIKPLPTYFAKLKYWGKMLFSNLHLYHLGQWLGYSRYIHEHKAIFKQAGYYINDKGDFNKDLMWIEIEPNKSLFLEHAYDCQ